jgi:hypothetical protein
MLTRPERGQEVCFPAEFGTRFWVTIDTEEDFDWTKPFSRIHHDLGSVPKLAHCQEYFAAHAVRPIYLVDWPIIDNPDAGAMLRAFVDSDAAEVGAQLHPWVNPPFEEVVNSRNSYTGNLPEPLQRAKLTALRDRISAVIGRAPRIYRAGRYGLGTASATMLSELGFDCDTSVRSGFDYRAGGGPDYRHMPVAPYWAKSAPALLEAPLTTVFPGAFGENAYHKLGRLGPAALSLAARIGLTERIALTPEGIPADRACAAIDAALARQLPLLNFSFHSPSLEPGHTPYVRTASDLDAFYRWWDVVLDHLARRGVAPTTAAEVVAAARQGR